jgi:hypothetical protein
MSQSKSHTTDPLLKAAMRAERDAKAAQESAKEAGTSGGQLYRAFTRAADIGRTIMKYAGPVGSALAWTGGKLKDAFMWASFEREDGKFKLDDDGDKIFSKKRLGKVVAGTMAAMLAFNVAASAGYFYGTQFTETVYTTGKQEIVTGEEYQFSGCTSLPCSTAADNGKFYKINSSLMFPNLIYPEEDVYANIPVDNAACEVEGYGIYFRPLRYVIKSMDWWQNAYSVQCRPLTNAERDAAIEGGPIGTYQNVTPQISAPSP